MYSRLGSMGKLSGVAQVNPATVLVLFLLQCLISTVFTQNDPSFRLAPQDTEVIQGRSQTLYCEVSGFNPSSHTVYWLKQPAQILFDNHARRWAPTRMTMMGNLQNGEFYLNITNAHREDHGQYECQIVQYGVRKANLTVLVPPSITFDPPTPLKIMENASGSLRCIVDANPPVSSVKWYKDGILQSETNFELNINSANKAHQGAYRCEAQNRAGTTSRTNNIDVLYAPKVTIPDAVNGELRVKQNSNLNVLCNVDANPEGSVFWEREGTSQTWPGNTLTLNNIREHQKGTYICKAKNSLLPTGANNAVIGIGSANIKLIVQFKPGRASISQNQPSDLVVGGSVSLTCTVDNPGEPAAQLVWTKQDDPSFSFTGPELQLTGLKLSDDGIYICTPRNSIGDGNPGSYQLIVNEETSFLLPTLDTRHNVSTTDRDFELMCRVRGRPEPVITWFKDNKFIPPSVSMYYKITKTQQSIDLHSFNVTSVLKFQGSGRNPSNAVRVEDRGAYKCVATSVGGGQPSRTTELQVLYPPMLSGPRVVAVDMNESALIVCKAHAVPAPTFEWFNGSDKLSDNERISITTQYVASDKYPYISQLNISKVHAGDMASYRCVATNQIGPGEITIELTVKSFPYAPQNLTIESFTWESTHLSWVPGFDGGYPQQFYIDTVSSIHSVPRIKVTPENASEHNITVLRPSTKYTFLVYGQNARGPGEYSNSVSVTTSAFTISPPAEVKFNKNTGELTFKVTAEDQHCVRVEISENNVNFTLYTPCAPPDGGSVKVQSSKPVNHVNVSLCLHRRQDVCSVAVSAEMITPAADVPMTTIIIVASVCSVVVVILLLVLLILCCRRRQQNKKYSQQELANKRANPQLVNNGKGYDNSGLEPKDSVDLDDPRRGGVFATEISNNIDNSRFVNYSHYPQNGPLPNGHAVNNEMSWPTGRVPNEPPPSYDPYYQYDTYHPSRPLDDEDLNMKNYYLGNSHYHPQMYPPKQINRNQENGMLDMNSSGESVQYSDSNKSSGSMQKLPQDSSSNKSNESGYSTPDPTKPNKKVIYEVMV